MCDTITCLLRASYSLLTFNFDGSYFRFAAHILLPIISMTIGNVLMRHYWSGRLASRSQNLPKPINLSEWNVNPQSGKVFHNQARTTPKPNLWIKMKRTIDQKPYLYVLLTVLSILITAILFYRFLQSSRRKQAKNYKNKMAIKNALMQIKRQTKRTNTKEQLDFGSKIAAMFTRFVPKRFGGRDKYDIEANQLSKKKKLHDKNKRHK